MAGESTGDPRAGALRVIAGIVAGVAILFLAHQHAKRRPPVSLDAHRDRGTAWFENEEFDRAISEFTISTRLGGEAADWANLGLALCLDERWDKALPALETARKLDPQLPQVSFGLGLAYKKLGRNEDAIGQFERVIAADPGDAASYYNLGDLYAKAGRHAEAAEAFRAAARHDPQNASAHYHLFTYARQEGRAEEAERELAAFNHLQDVLPAYKKREISYELGRYSKPVLVPRRSFSGGSDSVRHAIRFRDVTAQAGLHPGGGTARFADLDHDGDLDIVIVGRTPAGAANHVFLNGGDGHFEDATDRAGIREAGAVDAVFPADFDGDGAEDLFAIGPDHAVLLRNRGDASFDDVSRHAQLERSIRVHRGPEIDVQVPTRALACFIDYDHDGDLDLAMIRDGKPLLWRNKGDGSFASVDRLEAASSKGEAFALLAGDFDEDDDTDLLEVRGPGPSYIHPNLRGGRFGSPVALPGEGALSAETADFDNDGHLDILLLSTQPTWLRNDGKAGFAAVEIPAMKSSGHIFPSQLLDFDNDGLLDVILGGSGTGLFAGNGTTGFSLISDDLFSTGHRFGWSDIDAGPYGPYSLDAGDIDGDGDQDLLAMQPSGAPMLLESAGGEAANWLDVDLAGARVPKDGVGAHVEVVRGPYYQRREAAGGRIHFGLGAVDSVDAVRVTWTNGIVQNEVAVVARQRLRIEELVRTDASCPFLFAFDGTHFNYVNECLGVAAMGVPFGPGIYHVPDPDEYVKIRGELLAPTDGHYLLRFPEELKETTYLDQAKLIAIDHPEGVSVYPNERFSEPPFVAPGIRTVRAKRSPIAARDDHGADILPDLLAEDHRYPANFAGTAYDGLAAPHWIELDLGDLSGARDIVLYLTGWIYWSSSSVNVAVSQTQRTTFEAVSLSVPDGHGRWVTVIPDIGLPNGKNSTLPVELTGRFRARDWRVRLATNMVLYWDEAFFATDEDPVDVIQCESPLVSADVHYRGFSAMRRDPTGLEWFDYDRASRFGPWRQAEGLYTRYGDVTGLVRAVDDRYVVYGPGDEVALVFDAKGLAAPPTGWRRDFFCYLFGWLKDSDPNTVTSETVEPLPFRGMAADMRAVLTDPREPGIARGLADLRTRPPTDTTGRLAYGANAPSPGVKATGASPSTTR